jgi:hypothetical protein
VRTGAAIEAYIETLAEECALKSMQRPIRFAVREALTAVTTPFGAIVQGRRH